MNDWRHLCEFGQSDCPDFQRVRDRKEGSDLLTDIELCRIASEIRKQAYAPYSEYFVGAALLTTNNKVFRGCNIENVSSGLTICAERAAIFSAVVEVPGSSISA